ncbi:MAG: type I-C CRISPR-associated protein Cas5c [Eubacteriales bacterium]|nr:type I-C CRISPR-associated protein Cas5c [Eubacteriales bacterium]
MENPNIVTFRLYGRFALFSDPVTRVGGEKCSYLVPTYEALKGVCESIYWKPTFTWFVDKVRVMNAFGSQSKGVRPITLGSGPSTLSIYTYLSDVVYQVQAHFEWNPLRTDLANDHNENKHFFMAKRSIEKGGRRDIFLGTRECQGYVEAENFGEGKSAFAETEEMSFGLMFHGFDYGDEGDGGALVARFWYPKMKNGVIEFCQPEKCPVRRRIKTMEPKRFVLGENLRSVEEECP